MIHLPVHYQITISIYYYYHKQDQVIAAVLIIIIFHIGHLIPALRVPNKRGECAKYLVAQLVQLNLVVQ